MVVDHLTRYVKAWPTKSNDSKSAIAALEKYIIFRHSCPREILTDRRSSFTSDDFRNFCEKYRIKLLFTAAYKPDTNGVCERHNDVIKSIISKPVNENHTNWDQYILLRQSGRLIFRSIALLNNLLTNCCMVENHSSHAM